ncbi:hypothetical protein N9770_05475 [Amylibacter sp.]|nr:hypothetical protein [Amylibacter sp.]
MNDKVLCKNSKEKLVLCIGHISHLIFFLRLDKTKILDQYSVSIILQLNKSFSGREQVCLKIAKSISSDLYILESKYCPFYGRNFIKQIYKGFFLKSWLRNNFDKDLIILGHGASALTTNIIMSYFKNKILFKQFNKQPLIGFKLDIFNTLLVNVVNFSLNLKHMSVRKLPNAEHDTRVFVNNLFANIVEIDSVNYVKDVLNFRPIAGNREIKDICIVGIPFMNWGLSEQVRLEILLFYNEILKSLDINSSVFYLRHPNETNLEIENIQNLSGVKLTDVTNRYAGSEHFFIENPEIQAVYSVGSYAAISAYMSNFYTKVFFKDINFDNDTARVYEDKFQSVGQCIHFSFKGEYTYPNVIENMKPLEIVLEKFYKKV